MERIEDEVAPLGDAAEAVNAYLAESGMHGFSATKIRHGEIVVKSVDQVPSESVVAVAALAGDFNVRYERVDQEIQMAILRSDKTREIERIAREVFAAYPVHVTYAPNGDPGPQLLAGPGTMH